MDTFTFTIGGPVSLQVTLTELADGSMRFDLLNQGTQVADLRGFFFDVHEAGILSSLKVVGAQVTGKSFADDAVQNLGGGVTMAGASTFDAGLVFGTAGIGKDDIRSTSFTLSSGARALQLEDFAGMDFGVRYTSVGTEGGSREDSLKLVGSAPTVPSDPVNPFPDGPPPPPPPGDIVIV